MKRFTALCLAVVCMLLLSSGAFASNRYDPKDWYYIVDRVANTSFNEASPDRYYGGNCKEFVRHVCSSEDRGYLPSTNDDGRTLGTLTTIDGGQWLNDEHGRGPTSAEVKAVFANAVPGDVVQMYWGGTDWHNPHTALINDIDDNGVTFFQSHVQTDSTKICGYTVSSNPYDWETLSARYSFDATLGGLSIYSFNNTGSALPEGSVRIDEEHFPDESFRNYVLGNCDTNGDGILSAEEATSVSFMGVARDGITNLKGIEYFTALTELNCQYNQLTALDVSKNTALTELNCGANQLTALDVSGCTALTSLACGVNKLTALDVSNNTSLTYLYCTENQLTAIDVSNNTALTYLYCYNNQLTALDVSGCTALTHLYCQYNQLTELDVSKNTDLRVLGCDWNQLTELDVSNNTALEVLNCAGNKLTELDVSNCQNLSDWHIRYDSGVKIIRNKPGIISALVDIASKIPVNIYTLRPTVIDTTAQLIEAVSQSNIIPDTTAKETLHNVARGLQILSSIYSGSFLTRFFPNANIPAVLKSSGDDDTEKFQLSESLSLNVTPSVFKTSKGTVKITVAASQDVSQDVFCTIVSDDSCRFFTIPASGDSRRLFTAEFKAEELFASLDAGVLDVMCVSGVSDDEGICGMLMSNVVRVEWLTAFDRVSITTTTLRIGTIGKSYGVTLRASGTRPITWTAEGLPDGLSISERGRIYGKPTVFGDFTVRFTASNVASSAEIMLPLTIRGIKPKLSGTLAKATLSQSYSSGLRLARGSTPITWSISGNLPEGLTFDTETGVISGTPLSYSRSGFRIRITASNGAGSKSKSLRLMVKGTRPAITTTSLPDATQGSSYSATLTAEGSQPITWSAANLPAGLTVSGDMIVGKPTESGTFRVRLRAENPVKYARKTVTLKVSPSDDTRLPALSTGESESHSSPYSYLDGYTAQGTQNQTGNYVGDYVVVAELGVISCDEAGLHEFGVTLSDDACAGDELIYVANSDNPSDDDSIADFYDDTGREISAVPENRRITIAIWLNTETIYDPVIAVKR